MKIENIIKLTREVIGMQSNTTTKRVFIEGLVVRLAHTTFNDENKLSIKAYNNDWSIESAEMMLDFDMNVTNQIRNLIDRIDEVVFHHDRIKRLKKVTNQQA